MEYMSTELDATEGPADNDYAGSLEEDDSDDSSTLSDESDSEEELNGLIFDSLPLLWPFLLCPLYVPMRDYSHWKTFCF